MGFNPQARTLALCVARVRFKMQQETFPVNLLADEPLGGAASVYRGAGLVLGVVIALALSSAASAQDSQPDPATFDRVPHDAAWNEQPHGAAIDAATQAELFGAAFKATEEAARVRASAKGPVGMRFLPGRGLVCWDTSGKTPEEQREAEVEAVGLADVKAVQQELAAQRLAAAQAFDPARQDAERAGALALRQGRGRVGGLNVAAITGTTSQAGGVTPLNNAARQVAAALGVKPGAKMKGKARLYLFGAVSGRAVGLNLTPEQTGWKNSGLTEDKGGFIGQQQVGVAWRKGTGQAALSVVRDKFRTPELIGIHSYKDNRVMLSMSFAPQWTPATPHPDVDVSTLTDDAARVLKLPPQR